MFRNRRHALIWGGVLALLLLANLLIHWPAGKKIREEVPPSFLTEIPDEKTMAGIDEGIGRLPEEKQAEARRNIEEHVSFLKSVQDLPKKERLAKIQEHLASSPMPFLPMPPMPPGTAPDGADTPPPGGTNVADTNTPSRAAGRPGQPPGPGPGGGGPGSGRIPPPEVRYNFDKQIAGQQEKAKQGQQ